MKTYEHFILTLTALTGQTPSGGYQLREKDMEETTTGGKITLGIILGILISFVAWLIFNEKTIDVLTICTEPKTEIIKKEVEVSIIAEEKRCDELGGEFIVQWGIGGYRGGWVFTCQNEPKVLFKHNFSK